MSPISIPVWSKRLYNADDEDDVDDDDDNVITPIDAKFGHTDLPLE